MSKIPNTSDGKLLHRPSTNYKRLLGRFPLGIIYIALAKSWSVRGGSHPLAYYSLKVYGAFLR